MELFERIRSWGKNNPNINSILLVGSYARDEDRIDSDIDLVIIVNNMDSFIKNHDWINLFGKVTNFIKEDWGKVQSLRVFYNNNVEIEFGLTELDWVETPVDSGTFEVVNDGCKIILDKKGLLKSLVEEVALIDSRNNSSPNLA